MFMQGIAIKYITNTIAGNFVLQFYMTLRQQKFELCFCKTLYFSVCGKFNEIGFGVKDRFNWFGFSQ